MVESAHFGRVIYNFSAGYILVGPNRKFRQWAFESHTTLRLSHAYRHTITQDPDFLYVKVNK